MSVPIDLRFCTDEELTAECQRRIDQGDRSPDVYCSRQQSDDRAMLQRRNMADALEWYAEQALAAARHSIVPNANALAAIVQVLALDAGDRAKRALTPVAKERR